MEEELYVKGNVVVWSRGLFNSSNDGDDANTTVCCYSSHYPIKHALWCTFHVEHPNYDREQFNIENMDDKPNGAPLSAVCIVDTQNITVYTEDSEDFINTLPFQVANVWNSKFGILLEKQSEGKLLLLPLVVNIYDGICFKEFTKRIIFQSYFLWPIPLKKYAQWLLNKVVCSWLIIIDLKLSILASPQV